MTQHRPDGDVSPMDVSPRSVSPENPNLQPAAPPVSKSTSDTLLPPVGLKITALSDPPGSTKETKPASNELALGQGKAPSSAIPRSTPASTKSLKDHGISDRDFGLVVDGDGQDNSQAPSRPSIQFTRPDGVDTPPTFMRGSSWEEPETPGKSRGASLMSKLKALTNNGGVSTPKSSTVAGPSSQGIQSNINSPTRPSRGVPGTLTEEDTDADADAEETADEGSPGDDKSKKKKQKRRMRRTKKANTSTPGTPRRFVSDIDVLDSFDQLVKRRASMPDATVPDYGVSEGEGRDRLGMAFRRGNSWMTSAVRHHGEETDEVESPGAVGRRTGHVRRITVFGGGGVSDGDAMTPRRPFFTSERASTFGAQKWKQVKNTLKLLRQKKEDRFDYFKSAELMAELRAGAPAVLMLASMIQRDEHGNKRIPVLLEQLKLRITDSSPMEDDDKDRHWLFTIELEYGSGPSRMSWTVTRTLRDIYNLHLRYKFAINNEKYMPGRMDLGGRPKQPKFPYSAFPYLRGARKKGEESDEEDQASIRGEEETAGEGTATEAAGDGILSDPENPGGLPRRKSRNFLGMGPRRRSTGITDPGDMSNPEGPGMPAMDMATRRQRYVEKQRRILEKYLSEMIRWLMFRADSNRLCRFLELSALGVRLAAEGSYHGKECYLHIQPSKGLDFRRALTPAKVISRHSRKWFLVRQSYIVCVESPENMNIFDVYLVDSKFSISSKRSKVKAIGSAEKKAEIDLTVEAPPDKHHTMTLRSSERKVRLFSRNQSVMKQFEDSINQMLKQTPWYQNKRFDSFSPVRNHVFAQWLVDGRDYMWNVSRAINMARDVIYIHDWWLSPELYMRRPAAISQKWRLDRLLQKKAREGVKVFVIVYRNVEAAIPIDSEYTKFSLLNLHPNIFVQRSPNQFKKNQFFFAHHEKICIVDHDVAFVGGIDLCFGRWDSPQHPIVDDKPTGFEMSETPKDAEHCQLFPGKDYSNPRVQDFFRLNEPYEEMYDRSKVPRMPWHDVAMQVVGQPARDLTRHFVQRWNYLRRGRKPTRPLPFLLPPPDANVDELKELGLTGTCEVQILRSATTWSLGIEQTEHSIQNAYIKMIEESDHFVYMENQFFITSTEAYNTRIVNRIGDALVERIIRAHENDEDWRCVIVIPLMPGFQNTVDEQEGTSVRLILMCQYASICRGEQSIFGRLRAAGIEPEDYIAFYSLRQWGIMSNDVLVTEQLYIHAKTIIVDDRVALIGSANINERSMLGSRDSECAAIVRDTDMINSTMAGRPYQVGRFAHTLRLRLMREHLGLDVDEILEQERQAELDRQDFEKEMEDIYNEENGGPADSSKLSPKRPDHLRIPSINHDLDAAVEVEDDSSSSSSSDSNAEVDSTVINQAEDKVKHELDVTGYGPDRWKSAEKSGLDAGRDSVIINGREVLVSNISNEGKGTLQSPKETQPHSPQPDNRYLDPGNHNDSLPPVPALNRRTTDQLGLPRPAQLPSLPISDDTDIGGPPLHIDPETGKPVNGVFHPMAADIHLAHIDKDCMVDPVNPNFIDEIWNRAAQNNTKLYRRVFRCMPDSEVSTWAEYREYTTYGERFRASMEGGRSRGEDSEFPPSSRHRGSTAGGAGVSAPGPEVMAKAVETEAEKAIGRMTEKLPLGHHEEDRIKIVIPDESQRDVDEKQAMKDGEAISSRPTTGLENENGSDAHQHIEASSPVYSPGDTPFPAFDGGSSGRYLDPQTGTKDRERRTTFSTLEKPSSRDTNAPPPGQFGSVKRRRRATTKNSRRGFSIDDMPSRGQAEELLNMVQGNIVQFPYDWLLTEEQNGNWGYQVDGVAPLAIYN
ncbi:phospholipase D [Fusarium oxysporum f. sp. raphani 54005]|uniref:Phospholipase D1 n=2 Tax=Fusarium oxysporum TaxID=5507 RepID=X0CJ17_FUSOX|nr:phospholipase D [Fusarium oxysporum f. sp. pisi HDV247]EXK91253.1 phospholipase D [Fusarium oxysporum f. sp. raphani 54005]KAJ4052642.1 Phospholipase D1 [Fusarium oxysporum]KAJ4083870.1 Phospholipase D1 [Fusarium oxysporum]KAJ4084888.1 Phospholipase D1 [Fusarium oxysporum]